MPKDAVGAKKIVWLQEETEQIHARDLVRITNYYYT